MVNARQFAAAILVPLAAALQEDMPGGWTMGSAVTDDTLESYYSVMGTAANYQNGAPFLCALEFTSVDSQIAAGTNYAFHVNGCEVWDVDATGPDCSTSVDHCSPSNYVVKISIAPWMNIQHVESITAEP